MLKTIAQKEKVSKKYLEQIAIKLIKANLVASVRGRKGGYVLTKPPSRIRVLDIYNILEEKHLLVACLKNPGICSLADKCRFRQLYAELQRNINIFLNRQNLSRLISR